MAIDFDGEYFTKNILNKKAFLLKSALGDLQYDWNNLDELLYSVEVSPSLVKLIRGNGDKIDIIKREVHYGRSRDGIDIPRLYHELNDGATLVLNRLESSSLIIKRLCNSISMLTQGETVANGYLAKCGDSPFGNHWDNHDVFAVQLLGKKRWKIYKPTVPNPVVGQKSKYHKDSCPEEPVIDVITQPGDVLYIPRGWWHCAYPSEDECFHIAIGVHRPYALDYANWVLGRSSHALPNLRKSVLLGESNINLASTFNEVKEFFIDETQYSDFQQQIFYKCNFNNGPNMGFFASAQPDISKYNVALNTPYIDMLRNSSLPINGFDPASHSLTKLLLAGPIDLQQLHYNEFSNWSASEFIACVKQLLIHGVIHLQPSRLKFKNVALAESVPIVLHVSKKH